MMEIKVFHFFFKFRIRELHPILSLHHLHFGSPVNLQKPASRELTEADGNLRKFWCQASSM